MNYWLRDKPKEGEKVVLEFLDGDTVIRTFTSEKPPKAEDLQEQARHEEEEKDRDKPLEPKEGLNRFVWDMRVLKPTLAPKAVFNEGTKASPKVAPGTYRVRLTVGNQPILESFEVRPHPAGFATAADLKAQYDLLKSIRDRLSDTHTAVLKIRDVRQQVKDLSERSERLGRGDALAKQAASLTEKLTAVEEQLTNPKIQADEDDLNYEPKLDHDWTYLAAIVASADSKPTPSSVQYYNLLKERLDAVQGELAGVLEKDLKSFNASVQEAKIPPVVPAPKMGT